MIATLAGAAPLALAGKAVGVLTSLAETAKQSGFHDAFEDTREPGQRLPARGDGASASPGLGVDGFAQVEAGAAPVLPPPPPVSQQPLPPDLANVRHLYDQLQTLR